MEAQKWMKWMITNVRGSIPLPLHNFCLFVQPYLLSKGFTNLDIINFALNTRPILLKSLLEESISGDCIMKYYE